MTPRRPWLAVLAALLVGLYAFRAVQGAVAGYTLIGSYWLGRADRFVEAAAWLDLAAVGANRLHATKESAEAWLNEWDSDVRMMGRAAADPTLLPASAAAFVECRCIAPASRWSWEGLGEVYNRLEWTGREQRALRGTDRGDDPWSRVGRPGRVSIGLLRGALRLAPNWYPVHDKLATTLWSYGLDAAAKDAFADAARAQPLFWQHDFADRTDLPDWAIRTFRDTARDAIGRVPLISKTHHRIDLGKLQLRMQDWAGAAESFSEALEGARDPTQNAEARYLLGRALMSLGRDDEARPRLEQAAEHEKFRGSAYERLSEIAERQGRLEAALDHLRDARDLDPRNLRLCLRYADIARRLGDWPAALEALRWARVAHPEDAQPIVALVELHLDRGDVIGAKAMVRELESVEGLEVDLQRLRREIADAQARGSR